MKQGGKLSDHKGLNKQGGGLSAPALTDKDRRDIESAARYGLDFMSVSFARNADDIEEARSLLRAAGGQAHIVAKIERAEAVQHIRSIIDASDIIMVARGDLAVEVGYASMTGLQKRLDPARARAQQGRDHGHADARVDDPLAVADARRGLGRRERGHGRHGRRDAVGRNRGRPAIRCARCARWPSSASAPRSTRRSAAPRTIGSRTCSRTSTRPSRWR